MDEQGKANFRKGWDLLFGDKSPEDSRKIIQEELRRRVQEARKQGPEALNPVMRYRHIRGTMPDGREVAMTICYVLDSSPAGSNPSAPRGNVAFCSPSDHFSKRIGRFTARKKFKGRDGYSPYATQQPKTIHLFSPIIGMSFVEYLCSGMMPTSPSWVAKADWDI